MYLLLIPKNIDKTIGKNLNLVVMKAFLKQKNIEISLRRYGIDALNAMALGLFGSLIIGLILKNIGIWAQIEPFITMGTFAQKSMGAAIGACVAYSLGAPILVLGTAAIVGLLGNELGGPVGCFISVLFATELGKLVSKSTKIDIIITPFFSLVSGMFIAHFIGHPIKIGMQEISNFIGWAVALNPFMMGIILSVSMGMLLTLPISSAAIAISLSLGGLAAGASTVGCCAQMIGFAVLGYRENKMAGLLSVGLGTSMLQMPNIIRNWKIWIPPIVASAILGPISILIFKMQNIPSGAGMGTNGLVGQIGTIDAMGTDSKIFISILFLHFIAPAIICFILGEWMRKKGWIKDGDLKIE